MKVKPSVISPPSFEDPAAEGALLGSMICDPVIIDEVSSTIGTDDFYRPEHRIIFDGIRDTFDRFGGFDLVLLRNQLQHKLADVGGVEYLVKVAESTPSSASWSYYARIIQEASIRRKMIAAVHRAGQSLADGSVSMDEVLAKLQEDLGSVQGMQAAEAVWASEVEPRAIQWLWPNRFPMGMTSILAGEMKLGKSQIAMQIGAIVSRGRSWPDGAAGSQPGGVLMVTGEDDAARAIVPRLKASVRRFGSP
jgi:hypothetical protein